MRLLNAKGFYLRTFYDKMIPSYAILSHTWLEDHEEVSFAQIQFHAKPDWRTVLGGGKIRFLCEEAIADGFEWVWIDTCCIDKTNHVELSEAINSMFRWYQTAQVCYVYLVDINSFEGHDFLNSRWWTRAWTLQELVAPLKVKFFDAVWNFLGSKEELEAAIVDYSRIDAQSLRDPSSIYSRSVAQRMAWAASREATREEDTAYALLGIFDINMTMQYGEGEKAFVRLQRQISRTTNDMSIFAWGFDPRPLEDVLHESNDGSSSSGNFGDMNHKRLCNTSLNGLYASHPRQFARGSGIVYLGRHMGHISVDEHHGLQRVDAPMILSTYWRRFHSTTDPTREYAIVLLPCAVWDTPHCIIAILLRRADRDSDRIIRKAFIHETSSCLIKSEHLSHAVRLVAHVEALATDNSPRDIMNLSRFHRTLIVKLANVYDCDFRILVPTQWKPDSSNPHMFRADTESATDCHAVIRFVNRSRSQRGQLLPNFYVGLWFASHKQIQTPGILVLTRAPASARETELIPQVRHALGANCWPQSYEEIGDRRALLAMDNGWYAEVVTRITYNQAVSTLTFGYMGDEAFSKWNASLHSLTGYSCEDHRHYTTSTHFVIYYLLQDQREDTPTAMAID